jgi:hypothetical protein
LGGNRANDDAGTQRLRFGRADLRQNGLFVAPKSVKRQARGNSGSGLL